MNHLLVIEDDPDHRELIDHALNGHQPRRFTWTFRDSLASGAAYLGNGTPVDLILLDLSLPDSAYNETLPRMLKLAGPIPIIVLTSLDDSATLLGMINQGAKDCVPKTLLNSFFLERTITYSLDREHILRESVNKERQLVSERAFHQLVERQKVGVAIMDFDGSLVDCNPAFRKLLGLQAERISWLSPLKFLSPADKEALEEAIGKLASGHPGQFHFELEFKLPGMPLAFGELFLQAIDWPETGKALMCSLYDLTRRKQAEDELKTALSEKQREIEAKSGLISMLSHDIRNPVSNILSIIEILHLDKPESEDLTYLRTIEQLSRNVLNLIENILTDARYGDGKLQIHRTKANIREVVTQITALHAVEATWNKIKLNVEIDTPKKEYFMDVERLRQILTNLLGNAIKFTPELGRVDVRVWETDGTLLFSIKDTGIGVSPRDQENLFRPFGQANHSISREYGGTGLGLSICKRLCDHMDGSITLESEEGKGAEFIVALPCPEA